MRRLLSLLLCALLCIGLMSAVAFASGEKYTVTYQLTGMTADGQPLEAVNGTTLAIRLTTMQGYEAPDAITVKIRDTELKEGRDYTAWVMGGGTWIAVNIAGACITGDITITAEATAVNVSDNANLSAIEYYDGGLWKNIQLTDEQIQDALTPEGANIIMSHGCLDNQYITIAAVQRLLQRNPMSGQTVCAANVSTNASIPEGRLPAQPRRSAQSAPANMAV